MAYSARTTAPSTYNKYYKHTSAGGLNECIHIKGGSVLPNCVGYAWGRFYEISGKRPKLSRGNAETWYNYNDGYKRGKTPKLGAVIVWSKGKVGVGSDGAGHVAIVEKIYSDGSIMTSNSGYGSTRFYMKKIAKGYALSGYKFQGFIYNPAVKDSTVTKSEKPAAKSLKVGSTYTLQVNLNVRTGAGTKYSQKKVRDLTADGEKHATSTKASDRAVFKKGTRVTVQKISGNWIKCPSGWLCWKEGSNVFIK
ncbi:MAG: CHAP domain-containing protein [Lentihominibacter sp.]